MAQTTPFIVGRQSEVALFANLVSGRTAYRLLNIYGPGGIGKTVVGQKLLTHAQQMEIPCALVDGNRADLTPDRILYGFMEGLVGQENTGGLTGHFNEFDRQFRDYLAVNQILQRGGGIQTLFDVVGNVQDPTGLTALLASLGGAMSDRVHNTIHNRFALERYLRGAERALTATFMEGLASGLDNLQGTVALLFDTYEEMEGLDDWVCRTLVPGLPDGARLVILGRNQVQRINFDWNDLIADLHAMPLPELDPVDAQAYLRHYGLKDPVALQKVYAFTGGYPLLLVLVRHLAQEVGGWSEIGTLESGADRDHIATQLLERILRHERVKEVQSFLELGVVAHWFDPETIQVILEINLTDARRIYDELRRHSFVERHPYGLKFHDKVRELLLDRLKFSSPSEYARLNQRLMDYYAGKAGIQKSEKPLEEVSLAQPHTDSKYNINIYGPSQGLVIGDAAHVEQRFGEEAEGDPGESS